MIGDGCCILYRTRRVRHVVEIMSAFLCRMNEGCERKAAAKREQKKIVHLSKVYLKIIPTWLLTPTIVTKQYTHGLTGSVASSSSPELR